jgi:outer membrane protein OmpA-like peptidoglycan-associated protein
MCQHGVNLVLKRQDDGSKMQEDLVAFASEYAKGTRQPGKGVPMVAIMGDGSPTFLKGVNDILDKLGKDYRAKVIGSMGYSRGEDKFMGPAEWRANPKSAMGGVVAGVLRDGDWNIALKWLGDNSLPNNPDEKTWDPDALNWWATPGYVEASQAYIANACEDRPVVKAGKKTGETKKVCVQGVVTWTPGDVMVAQKKGGLVSILSTKENTWQMPNVIIGIDKWCRDNRETVEGMLSSIFEGGEAVRSSPAALKRASEASDAVYAEKDTGPAYWERYYRGAVEADARGVSVPLGGSTVNTLSDNLFLFGLLKGEERSVFESTYTTFGNIVVHEYPQLVPSFLPVKEVVDTTYVKALAEKSPQLLEAKMEASKPKYDAGKVKEVLGRKQWHITFASGSARFGAGAQQELDRMVDELMVAGGMKIEIHGHTDAQGTVQGNQTLSEERAFAVRDWLQKRSAANFPESRVQVFAHGQMNPVAPNTTEVGRAANRRVEIIIGTTG